MSADEVSQPLSIDELGHLIPVVWFLVTKNPIQPDAETLTRVFVGDRDDADVDDVPVGIRDLIHLDYRLDKPFIRELTELISAAQEVTILARENPTHKVGRVKLDKLTAHRRYDRVAFDHPDEVEWLRRRVETVVAHRSASAAA